MFIYELAESETHPVYEKLAVENGARQYDFLKSVVEASLAIGTPFLSQSVIKALNFHAITCLHTNAGELRPCEVTVGNHRPPQRHRVQALMDDFVNRVNRIWDTADPIALAAYVLWRLNYIHPFINGNGRTARAAAYFVLCLRANVWLPGSVTIPELIAQNRPEYYAALQHADTTFAKGELDLVPLHGLIERLLNEQLASAGNGGTGDGGTAAPAPAAPATGVAPPRAE